MILRTFLFGILLFFIFNATSQVIKPAITDDSNIVSYTNYPEPGIQIAKLLEIDNSNNIQTPWVCSVVTYAEATKHKGPNGQYIDSVKNVLNNLKINTPYIEQRLAAPLDITATKPILGRNFEGNATNFLTEGTPPDNTLAISKGGIIVSCINSNIMYFNESGTKLGQQTFSDFFSGTYTSKLYDPVLVYDPVADRFIFVVLHGSTSLYSKVLISFSKTNNPQNGWNKYEIAISSIYPNKWLDFPRVGISNNELFISGNIFTNSYNTFSSSVLFQIIKNDGYTGQTALRYKTWKDVKDATGKNAFTMVPASYGHNGSYGPGIYLVSTINKGGDSLYLYNVSTDMEHSPKMTSYLIKTKPYRVSGDAQQKGNSDLLSNGDCRVQSAFYLNNIIYFVFHSKFNDLNGYNGINYNQLNVVNKSITSKIIGLYGFDYSYPSVASASQEGKDEKDVIIGFLKSGSTIYPQIRTLYVDASLTETSTTPVKDGDTYVSLIMGEERWGDYSGICRKYNATVPTVWMSGCYATNNGTTLHTYKTWIAELKDANTGFLEEENVELTDFKVFPNPSVDMVNIEFILKSPEDIDVQIIDMEGRSVKVLYNDYTKAGKTVLSFNKLTLKSGIYFVVVRSQSKVIKSIKVNI